LFLAILGFLWRSIHHGGHEDHEEKQFKHKERSGKSEKSQPFVCFALFVVSQSPAHRNTIARFSHKTLKNHLFLYPR
jgi:hypothetical protein